jgi:MFS family permease
MCAVIKKSAVQKPQLRQTLRWATFGSMLAMVYLTGVSSPAFTDFIRALGGREIHFAWLGAIPLVMFALQFLGAFLNNRLNFRRRTCATLFFTSRLLYLGIAVLPYVLRDLPPNTRLSVVLVIAGISAMLSNLAIPLYFAWMADLVPHRLLSRYWGRRHAWLHLTWCSTYVAMAIITYFVDLPIERLCPYLIGIGVLAGISESVIILKMIPEPRNMLHTQVKMLDALLEPFRHRDYRSFVRFSCLRSAAVMATAIFIPYFLLETRNMALWQTIVLWCILGLGAAVSSSAWGRLAEKHGHRPVLLLTMCWKPLTMLAYVLPPPQWIFPFLTVWLFFDGIINAGLMVATTGYMLKMAPQRNRSMFIASILGLAGICGGLSALIAGKLLKTFPDLTLTGWGREWSNLDALMLAGVLLRVAVIPVGRKVREVNSTRTVSFVGALLGIWPLPLARYPVGLYRQVMRSDVDTDSDDSGGRGVPPS